MKDSAIMTLGLDLYQILVELKFKNLPSILPVYDVTFGFSVMNSQICPLQILASQRALIPPFRESSESNQCYWPRG